MPKCCVIQLFWESDAVRPYRVQGLLRSAAGRQAPKNLRDSIPTGDQNDLIISLDCRGAEVYLFPNKCNRITRSQNIKKGDPQ